MHMKSLNLDSQREKGREMSTQNGVEIKPKLGLFLIMFFFFFSFFEKKKINFLSLNFFIFIHSQFFKYFFLVIDIN